MSKNIFFSILLLVVRCVDIFAQCPVNCDAELGNFTNWDGYTGLNNGYPFGTLNLTTFLPGFVTTPPDPRHEIMTKGAYDPLILTNVVPVVGEGKFSFKLGNNINGSQAEILAFTFTVTPARPFLNFQYAMVLQDPNLTGSGNQPHGVGENPFFSYWISRTNILDQSDLPGNLLVQKKIEADFHQPFFYKAEGSDPDLLYKNWTTECVNLSEYYGETLTVYFATADCYLGGHFSYAYIDGFCTSNNTPTAIINSPNYICSSGSFFANGSKSYNYEDYYWKLEKLSSNNLTSVIPGTDVIEYHFNEPVSSNFNVEQMYVNGGKVFGGGYYKLTLGLRNCSSSDWIAKSVIVEVEYPSIIAKTKYICCDGQSSSTVQISADIGIIPGKPTGTVYWYDESGNFIGNGNSSVGATTLTNTLSVNVSTFSKFRVKYVSPNGCENEAWVSAIRIPEIVGSSIYVECQGQDYCGGRTLGVTLRYGENCSNLMTPDWDEKIKESFHYQWNSGETTQEITTTTNDIGNYSCNITWPCGTINGLTYGFAYSTYTGPYSISIPNAVHLYGSPWYIQDPTSVIYTTPAYNIFWYRLKIFDRWGDLVYEKEEYAPCVGGFWNGQISWDKRWNQGPNSGQLVQVESPGTVYFYSLEIENCTFSTPEILSGDLTITDGN